MAVVWEAIVHGASGFRKRVAVKRVLERFRAYPEVTAMFVEEARVGAALQHPNIVQVHDFGQDERGDYFLVSELVSGPHLGSYVKSFGEQQGAPWPMVAAICIEVLRALDAAHSRIDESGRAAPVLHRDVSPANILLDRSGVVKLADFGLARAMDRGRTTRPDIVKGKLSYLAPELVLGKDASPQSDLFAVGIVLWEALTGEKLFDAETDIAVVKLVREARVPLLAQKRPSLPLALTSVVHRALEREPERRFASAREMLQSLTGELRILPSATDSGALARSVADASRRLGTG
jgi:serine/threonine-protein kinase